MKNPPTRTNVSTYVTTILGQLSGLDTGRKSHQLIQIAIEFGRRKLAPGQWMNIPDALVHRGFLSVDNERSELRISDRGRRFLAEESELFVDIDQPAPVLPPEVQPQFDETLYNKLRWKRRKMAEDEGIPPYRIFTNRSLAEMATYRPESLEELQGLHGVGERLSVRYGKTFLAAIQYYLKTWHSTTANP
jgi:ATP-dependent DNA helicase RecQ